MNSDERVEALARGVLILACSLAAFGLAFVLPDGKPFADQGFNWYVNSGQHNLLAPRIAYVFFCLSLSICAVLLNRGKTLCLGFTRSHFPILSAVVYLSVLAFGAAALIPFVNQLAILGVSVILVCVSVFAFRILPRRTVDLLLLISAVAAFLIASVPGLSSLPDLSSHFPESIADIEAHQALSTAANVQLAQGAKLFQAVSARYGILWQSLLGAWTTLVHPLTVGDSIMFTRWLHTLFFAFASFAYFKFSRNKVIAACLAILFIAPWMELRQPLFVFPQVSSWRYFGFAAVPLIVLLLERTAAKTKFFILGITAGLCLLSDFASGISIAVGLLAYTCFLKQQDARLKLIGLYLGGIIISIAVFFGTFAAIFGYVPSASAFVIDLKNTIWEAAGGTAPALSYPFDPLAILILVHTAYVCLSIVSQAKGSVSPRNALRLSIGIISLLWFVHYVNEPNTFALRACRVLYAFFLIDLFRILLVTKKFRLHAKEPLWMARLLLLAIVVPAAVLSYQPAAEKAWAMVAGETRKDSAKVLVSGVWLPEEVGRALQQKAKFIQRISGQKPIYYLTADSSFIPVLSQKVSAAPVADPTNLVFAKQCDRLVQAITNAGANEIFVDDPDFVTSKGVVRRSCFDYLRVLLSRNYQPVSTSDGWQVWQKKQRQ